MPYFDLSKLPKKERMKIIEEFYDVITSLKNRKEVKDFLSDLLTPNEIVNLMRRVEIALLLISGFSYDEIHLSLGVSKDKILHVHRGLINKGRGYKIVIKRLLEKRKKKKIGEIKYQRKLARLAKTYNIESLKRKYPLHFLLVNLIDELSDHLYALSQVKSSKKNSKKKSKKIK